MTVAKTLFLDIESAPALAYVYGLWKQNIPLKQLIERPYLLSFAAIWNDDPEKEMIYEENRHNNDYALVSKLFALLDEAEVVVAHFGDRFDLPMILGRGIVHKLLPPSPYKTVDTCLVARKKFKFMSNSLSALCDELGVTPKDSHSEFEGFDLWKGCLDQDDKAWAVNKRYNIGDVISLRDLYYRLRPYIEYHPSVAGEGGYVCHSCGSDDIQRRGYHKMKSGLTYQRYQCNCCGSWSRSKTAVKSLNTNQLRSM